MSDYFDTHDDDVDRALPYDYRPGTDLISKMVLTDNEVINMVTKALLPEVARDHYVAAPTEFIDKSKCDVVYAPHDPLSTFPPVLIEVQNQVDEKFFVRAIHYSTMIYERYKKHPILVVIAVAGATNQFMGMTTNSNSFPFAREIACIGWAKQCLVLTGSTVGRNEKRDDEEEGMNALQALGLFLSSQSLSLSTLEYGKNARAMRLLYAVALQHIEQVRGEEDEKLDAISNICNSSEVQLRKIKECIEGGDGQKALCYIDDTLGFLKRQKRKYCDAIETTPIAETPPLLYLNKQRKIAESVDWDIEAIRGEFYDFVQKFKSDDTGRISWKACFEKGQQDDVRTIKHFASSESLRVKYYRLFK